MFDAIAGYDQNDPVTAYSVGHIPTSYTASLSLDGLRGARIGVIRQPMNANTDPASDDYRQVRGVFERAVRELQAAGAQVQEVTIPDVIERLNRGFDENNFETEAAMNRYLAGHRNAPFKTLREILLSGRVVPSRARTLMNAVGKTTDDPGYLRVLRIQEETRQVVLAIMADHNLDALMYTTYDHQPGIIADDVMTRQVVDDVAGFGHNRRLSPLLGCPAIAVPAGFTSDGLPVGIEFMTRPFTEPLLFRLAYAFEQRTRHRKPPASTPALRH